MKSKVLFFGVFFLVSMHKSVAMEYQARESLLEMQYQLKKNAQEIVDNELFLLEGKYAAEETSCCGVWPWRMNKAITDRAEIIEQIAPKNGLSEEQRAKITKFIKEREVLAGEWCCDDQGRCPRLENALAVSQAVCMAVKKYK